MSIGDITVLEQSCLAGRGGRAYNVAGGATTILPGEPVINATRGSTTVIAMLTNNPVAGSDYFVGIATTTSTQTSGTAGVVGVLPMDTSTTYLIAPKTAASFDTQSEYDALVGKYVLIDLTAGAYTILASDSANNGCVIQPLDIAKYPGKVAFAFREGVNTLR